MNKSSIFIFLALLAFGSMAWAQTQWMGNGTEINPYQINSPDDWTLLCTNVNNGNNSGYSGTYFKLMADISLSENISSGTPSKMVGIGGSDSKKFRGIFDGNGHTITVNYVDTRNTDFCAPFIYIKDATIKRLNVAGTIRKTQAKNAGGFVGKAEGANYITSCRSSVNIQYDKDGDVSSGGFVGELRDGSSTTFTDCLFDGKLQGTDAYKWGGFVGWVASDNTSTFINCLFNPESINVNNNDNKDFARKASDGTVNITNCYRKYNLSGDQGTNASGYSNEQLLSALGINWEINNNQVIPIMDIIFEGEGTEDNPYLIANINDWNWLAASVNNGITTYNGKFFKMTADFTVAETITSGNPTKLIGISEDRSFKGTFDGDNNTITLTINDSRNDDNYCGPFCFINGATIKNLHVAGTLIKSHKKHAGGLVGKAYGTNNIIGCRVSATVTASTDGDGSHGGFVGDLRGGTTSFLNCTFDGKLQGTNTDSWGGFVGYVASNCTANFTNCMFKPQQVNVDTEDCKTFARKADNGTVNFTNCYYTQTLGSSQGKQACTINAGEYVTVGFYGTEQVSSASGITAYSTDGFTTYLLGFKLNDVLYAGQSDGVQLNLSYTQEIPEHYTVPVYSPTGGTLSGVENPYTLTMPNSDVTINATLAPADWQGSGTENDPYLIYTDAQWGLLVSRVNDGNHNGYSGQFFKLMNDITLAETISSGTPTMMVGTSESNSFQGTFDGNAHTITLAYDDSRSVDYCAPFLYIKNATIKYLHVAGSIHKTKNIGAAGLVGRAYGTNYIRSSRVSVDIYFEKNGDVSSGGILADLRGGETHFENCLFDGKLRGSNAKSWGGFIGWVADGPDAYLTNCLFNPESISVNNSDSKVFARRYSDSDLSISNSYRKNNQLSSDQGSDAINYDNTQLLTALGNGWETITEVGVEKVVPIMSIYYNFEGEGTEASPYLINNADDWSHLATTVNGGHDTYSGQFFKVTNNFTVEETITSGVPTKMVGNSETRSFQGTFDGDGHTITLNYNDNRNGGDDSYCGPFRFIKGATIKNLHVAGTIVKTNKKHAGGLVGKAYGTNNIIGCRVSATVTASTDGDGSHGGFVGDLRGGTTSFLNCTFDGKLQGTNTDSWGGFVGYVASNCTANFTNCMFKPQQVNVDTEDCKTFARKASSGTVNFTNCYYTQTLGSSQGKQARTISAGEYVTVGFYGTEQVSSVSGITAYIEGNGYLSGLKVDDVLYASLSDNVKLNLLFTIELPEHYAGYSFTATDGSLSGTSNPFILAMPDNNVTVNAVLIPSEWEGEGIEDNPYLIYNFEQWCLLVSRVNDGTHNGYSGTHFRLMNNITLTETISTGTPTTMVGTSETNSFQGTFDGNGHTITLAYDDTRSADYIAPFLYVKDAAIKYLHVAGSIHKTKNIGAAGLVGRAYGTNYITSCRVSVNIQFDKNGDVSSGGIMADLRGGETNFENCLFDGKLIGHYGSNWGGFVGWVANDRTARFTNCLFNPELIDVNNSGNKAFARRNDADDLYFSNTYRKNDQLSTDQGVDASSYTNAQLQAALGIGWEIITEDNVEKVVPSISAYTFAGAGTENSPYLIANTDDWSHLAATVNSGATTYNGKYFKVTNDFTVEETINAVNTPNKMVGKSEIRSFQGTFDGDGHTITLNYIDNRDGSDDDNYSGPFRFVKGATIKNLHVAGTIVKTNKKHAGGLVGKAYGTNNIIDCRVSATITASTDGDGSHGGFLGDLRGGTTSFLNCTFDGQLQGTDTDSWGGFVGYVASNCTANFTNCMFKPEQTNVDTDDCKTFARKASSGTVNFTNCYYTQTLGSSQGKQARTISAGEYVTVGFYGTEQVSSVSGITAYIEGNGYLPGLKVGDVLYAGLNDNVKLNLDATIQIPEHYSGYVFTATSGTIDGTENPFTLRMPNSDVTVNATLVSGEWLGTGTEDAPYLIYTDDNWRLLASRVNDGTHSGYSGTYFKLMTDITLTETISTGTPTMMVGNNTNDNTKFQGTFDGNGHTITLAYNDTRDAEFTAPFLYVKNATIKYLHVAGSINKTKNTGAAGLVGRAQGTSYIVSNRVSVDIQFGKNGDVSSGGILADLDNGTIHIIDCLFDGKLQGPNAYRWGGFIGWVDSDSKAHITSCLFNPELINVKNSENKTFARRSEADDLYFSNLYRKNDQLGTDQGVDASSYTNTQLLAALGTGWEIVTENGIEKVVPIIYSRPFTGDGTEEYPYEIANVSQWVQIATSVNSGMTTFSGKFFRQTADFTVEETLNYGNPTRMIGINETNSFQGTYDGDGYTITLNYYDDRNGSDDDYCGPFRFIKGATIKNLYVEGTITKTYKKHAGGIVGQAFGTNNIINCRSSVHILASTNGDGSHGGFMGDLRSGTTNFVKCLFDGMLQGTTTDSWGGFVGYVASDCTANFTNCMFKPALVDVDTEDCKTFARTGGSANFTNCYYTQTVGGSQSKQARIISGGTDVIVEFYGSDTDNISGITAYSTDEFTTYLPGLLVDDVLYAGKDDNVRLNLTYTQTIPEHYIPSYTVNAGTLTGLVNPFTLKMPNNDVTINFAEFVSNEWPGSGTEDDPYLIYTDAHWSLLVSRVNDGNHSGYYGNFFKLMADITVTESVSSGAPVTMVGISDNNSFQGTFDGNGHTITLDYNDTRSADFCAPFRYIKNATIQYLHVDGTIYKTKGKNAGGLVGKAVGNNTISNCRSSVDIHFDKDGDVSSGGFIGELRESGGTTFTNCLFDGKLRGANAYKWGGFVGWVASGRTATFNSCLFNPTEIDFDINDGNDNSKTFVRHDGTVNVNNCYYTAFLNDAQGATDAHLYLNEPLLAALGLGWETIVENEIEKVVPIMSVYPLSGDGTEESPYLITSTEDWNHLASNQYMGESYNGKYFLLTNNISVTRMVGSDPNRAFQGTFDGGGNTITVSYGTASTPTNIQYCAPFAYTYRATIKNLCTAGTIYTSSTHAGGVVGRNGTESLTMTNVKSSVTINSTYNGNANHGGLVGYAINATFEGCVFNGRLLGANSYGCGGLLGWKANTENSNATFTNSLFAPTQVTVGTNESFTIAKGATDRVTINNCYYTQPLGTEQGTLVHSITPGDHVTIENAGTNPTEYEVSGLTCYSSGIMFDEVLYASNGENLSLNLTCTPPEGYVCNVYQASAGTLTGSDNPYSFTMPDEDVTINVVLSIGKAISAYTENGGWYLIASPVGAVNPENVAHMLSNAYDLYAFDQNPSDGMEWRNYKADAFNLEPGHGYLYANSKDVTLIFPGTPYTGSGEVTLSKTEGLDWSGWNLVGNPFNEIAYIADGRGFYTMNANGSEIEAATSTSIEAMEGIFVIANEDGETMTFSTTEPVNNDKGMLTLNVSHGCSIIDRAIVRFNKGDLLPKFQLNRNSTKVYIPMDGQDYAVVRSEGMGELPVSFKAKENGSYTLSLSSEEVEFSYLHLIDNMTGADVDLLAIPSYTFTAKTTDYASRFKLVFSAICEDANGDNDVFAYISNGNIIIKDGPSTGSGPFTLQVVDMTGRVIRSTDVARNVSTAGMAPGVYVLRLINGDEVKTQKIVVK